MIYRIEFNTAIARYLIMGDKGLVATCVFKGDADKILEALNSQANSEIKPLRAAFSVAMAEMENYANRLGQCGDTDYSIKIMKDLRRSRKKITKALKS
jgi:hypothetical protein